MTTNKYYSSAPVEGPFDIIIVGSGAGGLTSGAILSEEGKRVLILEQHFQPGGFTHTFTRKNYEWDVGLHYFGASTQTSQWYQQMAGLTEGAFKLEPFGEYIDELYFPDMKIHVPNSYDRYAEVLKKHFPHEAAGIDGYLNEIKYMRKKLQLYFGINLLPPGLTKFARKTFAKRAHKLATSTTEEVLSWHIKDDKLKAVLDAQWGNIGAPRQYCSFMVSAAMVGNYLEEGAAYPVGGGQTFAHLLGKVIYKNGGAIRTKAPVESLIIHNNTVHGVKLKNGEEIQADTVISNTGVFNTYYNFLKNEDSCQQAIAELDTFKPAYEYLNLFIGFNKDPKELGLGNGNTWIHPNWDTVNSDPLWDISNLEQNPNPSVLFFSSSSLRDPELKNRKHNGFNGQIVTAANYDAFSKWTGSRWKHREEDYHKFKEDISNRLISMLDEKYPGVKDAVDYMELGTALTYDYFTASYKGIAYSLAPVPERYASTLPRPKTPVKNLLLCGQDMIMPGVPAAVGSANLCCSLILRGNAAAKWVKKGKQYI